MLYAVQINTFCWPPHLKAVHNDYINTVLEIKLYPVGHTCWSYWYNATSFLMMLCFTCSNIISFLQIIFLQYNNLKQVYYFYRYFDYSSLSAVVTLSHVCHIYVYSLVCSDSANRTQGYSLEPRSYLSTRQLSHCKSNFCASIYGKKLYRMCTESLKGILFSVFKTLRMLLTANARELKLHFKLKKNNILIFRCFLFVT